MGNCAQALANPSQLDSKLALVERSKKTKPNSAKVNIHQRYTEEILNRFSHIEITGEQKYLSSSFIRGITDLPVKVHRL